MNPKTVAKGQVNTRLCLRGSDAMTSHQRANLNPQAAGAVEKSVETFRESLRATFGLQRVSDRHLFEREQKVRP